MNVSLRKNVHTTLSPALTKRPCCYQILQIEITRQRATRQRSTDTSLINSGIRVFSLRVISRSAGASAKAGSQRQIRPTCPRAHLPKLRHALSRPFLPRERVTKIVGRPLRAPRRRPPQPTGGVPRPRPRPPVFETWPILRYWRRAPPEACGQSPRQRRHVCSPRPPRPHLQACAARSRRCWQHAGAALPARLDSPAAQRARPVGCRDCHRAYFVRKKSPSVLCMNHAPRSRFLPADAFTQTILASVVPHTHTPVGRLLP